MQDALGVIAPTDQLRSIEMNNQPNRQNALPNQPRRAWTFGFWDVIFLMIVIIVVPDLAKMLVVALTGVR
jgi:hypothetical protein